MACQIWSIRSATFPVLSIAHFYTLSMFFLGLCWAQNVFLIKQWFLKRCWWWDPRGNWVEARDCWQRFPPLWFPVYFTQKTNTKKTNVHAIINSILVCEIVKTGWWLSWLARRRHGNICCSLGCRRTPSSTLVNNELEYQTQY